MEASGNTSSRSLNNNDEEKRSTEEEMQIDLGSSSSMQQPLRVPSPMITVTDDTDVTPPIPSAAPKLHTPTRERKKSPASGVNPRQRKRSQTVRGDLLPDPDKLLSYKHHDKKEEEELEDPTFPGGHPKPPPEPRQPGQPAERKRSNVTFCPVVQTIEK